MTMMAHDDLVLTLGSTRWRGWTEVAVTRGIEQAAGTFELTLTDVAGTASAPLRLDVKPGAPCRVEIEGAAGSAVLITGYVDDVAPSFDAGQHRVRVTGRDAAGDLVDCSAVHGGGEFKGATVLQIAEALAKPFGVAVRADTDVGAAFAAWKIQEGETVWECIERACRVRGVLCVSDGLGGIVLTRGSAARRTGATLTRRDMVEGSGTFSLRDRHSPITVKGQAALDDPFGTAQATGPSAKATDAGVGRHRPLIVIAEDLAEGQTLETRATWEANVRAARARRAEVVVHGWRDAKGALWRPLTLVTVREPWLGLDAEMMIAGVTLSRDGDQGTRSRLQLVGPDAFDLLPTKDPKAEKGLGW